MLNHLISSERQNKIVINLLSLPVHYSTNVQTPTDQVHEPADTLIGYRSKTHVHSAVHTIPTMSYVPGFGIDLFFDQRPFPLIHLLTAIIKRKYIWG